MTVGLRWGLLLMSLWPEKSSLFPFATTPIPPTMAVLSNTYCLAQRSFYNLYGSGLVCGVLSADSTLLTFITTQDSRAPSKS